MKITLGLIYGGKSTEHSISLESALEISRWIDYSEYDVLPIYIDLHGYWHKGTIKKQPFATIEELSIEKVRTKNNLFDILKNQELPFDIAVPILSGFNGEDGTIQGLFEMLDVPYTGNGVAASAIGMNKIQTKKILEAGRIPMVPYEAVSVFEWQGGKTQMMDRLEQSISYPLFIKPARLGSSIGIHRVERKEELEVALTDAFTYDEDLIIEKAVKMRELNMAVIGDENMPRLSYPGEIITGRDFYDYQAKYEADSTTKKIIAQLDDKVIEEMERLSRIIYKSLKGNGLMRIDYFLVDNNKVLFNEVNTLPSLAGDSMFPYMLNQAGCGNEEIFNVLIETARSAFEKKKQLNYRY